MSLVFLVGLSTCLSGLDVVSFCLFLLRDDLRSLFGVLSVVLEESSVSLVLDEIDCFVLDPFGVGVVQFVFAMV